MKVNKHVKLFTATSILLGSALIIAEVGLRYYMSRDVIIVDNYNEMIGKEYPMVEIKAEKAGVIIMYDPEAVTREEIMGKRELIMEILNANRMWLNGKDERPAKIIIEDVKRAIEIMFKTGSIRGIIICKPTSALPS